jgi:hypothetical protein
MQEWTVTRQFPYFYNSGNESETYVVEISMGDFNYTGPGMQTRKYQGEGDTFSSLLEAVDVAIRIRDQWKADNPDLDIEIGVGSTGGGMVEIGPTDMDDDELRDYAMKRDDDERAAHDDEDEWYEEDDDDDESGEWWDEGEWEEEDDDEEEALDTD